VPQAPVTRHGVGEEGFLGVAPVQVPNETVAVRAFVGWKISA